MRRRQVQHISIVFCTSAMYYAVNMKERIQNTFDKKILTTIYAFQDFS